MVPKREILAIIPISRINAMARAMLWGLLGVGLALLVVATFRGLQFKPSGASNRLVDYSIAFLLLPFVCVAVYSVVPFLRQVALACWPAPLGVFATSDELILRFGPFGSAKLDAGHLDIRYPFEEPDDPSEDGYEALLPEEMQIAQLCPRITHPRMPQRLDALLARRTGLTGEEIAAHLRPAIEYYRAMSSPEGEP